LPEEHYLSINREKNNVVEDANKVLEISFHLESNMVD